MSFYWFGSSKHYYIIAFIIDVIETVAAIKTVVTSTTTATVTTAATINLYIILAHTLQKWTSQNLVLVTLGEWKAQIVQALSMDSII